MDRALQRILSILMVVTIAFYTAIPAAADQNLQKEEVVYAKLSHDGRVDTIYVVNSFDMAQGGTVRDRGNYSEVRNLTSTDPIALAGGGVNVNAPVGKFYYEGVLKTQDMPWEVSVRFSLDGKPISGDRLAGGNGHLQIDLHIAPKPGANPVYIDNYAIQAAMSLDGERCTNIQAEDATIANVGKQKQLSYIILPGKAGDFTVTADVVDFEMDGISINGVPLSLHIDDPDTAEIQEKVTELQDGAVELDDGAQELYDGAVELDDGAQELYDGAVELDDGAQELDDGAVRLDDGVLTLEDGVQELEDGVEELVEGADDLRDGASELYNGTRELRGGVTDLEAGVYRLSNGAVTFGAGLSELAEQSEALVNGSAQFLQGLQQLESSLAGFDETSVEEMARQAAFLQTGSQSYLDTLDFLIADNENRVQGLLSLGSSGDPELQAAMETAAMLRDLRAGYLEIHNGVSTLTVAAITQSQALPGLVAGVKELSRTYAALDNGLVRYTQGVDQLHASYSGVTDGINELSHGVDDLVEGSKDLHSGARELYDGTYDLQDGVNRLSDGTEELRDGATQLRDGTLELRDGTVDLLEGTQELLDGTAELLDGTMELLDGTVELKDGTAELREKTLDMDEEMDDRIDELLEEYRGKQFDPVSFTDPANRVSSVQFVMLTEAVAIPETPVEAAPEPEKLTFWQRLRNLFSFL